MADTKDLAGRKAIVTGSATGLGRSIALQLAERGADVIINCTKSVSDAEQTVADCQAFGAQAVRALELLYLARVLEHGIWASLLRGFMRQRLATLRRIR